MYLPRVNAVERAAWRKLFGNDSGRNAHVRANLKSNLAPFRIASQRRQFPSVGLAMRLKESKRLSGFSRRGRVESALGGSNIIILALQDNSHTTLLKHQSLTHSTARALYSY